MKTSLSTLAGLLFGTFWVVTYLSLALLPVMLVYYLATH